MTARRSGLSGGPSERRSGSTVGTDQVALQHSCPCPCPGEAGAGARTARSDAVFGHGHERRAQLVGTRAESGRCRTVSAADGRHLAERGFVLCVAGEASGDALLGPVVAGLRDRHDLRSVGVGGDESARQGLEMVAHARDLAANGLGEALGSVPAWLAARRRLVARFHGARALCLVDFPELNMRLLGRAVRQGRPVAYVAPPQAWAWRSWRSKRLALAAWVGCLMPFEARWYAAHGVKVECVGHPLAERPVPAWPKSPAVALLPGSRDASLRRLLPLMLASAVSLRRVEPTLRFHLAVASTVDRMFVHRAVQAADIPVALHQTAGSALAASTVALAGAGTATLEAVLAGRAVVIAARVGTVTALVAERLLQVDCVGLPNLVLERPVFPELIQEGCHPAALARAIDGLLDAPARFAAEMVEVRERLRRPGRFGERVADRVAEIVERAEHLCGSVTR